MRRLLTAPMDVLPHPPAPTTVEESGLGISLILQLLLKTLHFAGELTGTELSRRLGLPFSVTGPVLDILKEQRHCQVAGGGSVGGPFYRYQITDAGRARAALFFESNQYVGVAPVPLPQYQDYMRAFRARATANISRERVRGAFGHLVLSPRVLDQLGPAVNAGHSIFVYGPPGNGKTVIAQSIRNLLEGVIAIPHAIEVEGHIVRLFDPVNHEEVPPPWDDDEECLTTVNPRDRRWVRCRRPMVTVGGELTLDALELSYGQTTGFYRAPVQAIANGGVLIIDDFGRQRCSPRDLLNRWIIPLESRVDFHTLQTGQKFELPFMAIVVFATNIRPAELIDEAFLRRIQYKIAAESPSVEDFGAIFQKCCREFDVTCDPRLVDHVLFEYYRPRRIPLRGCHPRDLIKQALTLAAYLGRPRHLTLDLIEAACQSYFVEDREEIAIFA